MIALKAATAAIVAIYAKTSFRKSALFIASTDFSSRLILVNSQFHDCSDNRTFFN